METPEIKLKYEGGKELLNQLSLALQSKDINALCTAMNRLQNAVDEKKMCSPMSDEEIRTLLSTGEATLYVGTGSLSSRIFITKEGFSMPVSDSDLRHGYGKRCQDNFRRLFNIPEGQDLSVTF